MPVSRGLIDLSKDVGIPPVLASKRFVSLGATGWVYRISDLIVVKYAVNDRIEELAHEAAIYEKLQAHNPRPYLMQSLHMVDRAIFLPFLPGSTLERRIWANQERARGRFVRVLELEDATIVERWAAQVCIAVTWLDSLGLVHGDLRPANVLLDAEEDLKLTDFDCAARVGEVAEGGAPPWSRQLSRKGGSGYGKYGPATESFAIGSILYFISRSMEPYEDIPGPDVVDLLIKKLFPPLDISLPLDRIIEDCWHGRYTSLRDLEADASHLDGAKDVASKQPLSEVYCRERRNECIALVEAGLLQSQRDT